MDIRPMLDADVVAAEACWSEAFTTMRASFGLPLAERTPEVVARTQRRIRHLLATDPGGSWVADDGGAVVGLAQALVRDELWVLSLLGVATTRQASGTGRALLDAARTYGAGTAKGFILSSRDPKAMRRYSRAGFDLNPSVTARGQVDPRRVPAAPAVRAGGADDVAFVADLDRRLRGGPHTPDLELLLAEGCGLWVLDGRGYVVARGAEPVFLGATTEDAAQQLLNSCLARADPADTLEVRWITSGQQWAVRSALDAGLALHPVGPVMTRGMAGPPATYLPSGAFG